MEDISKAVNDWLSDCPAIAADQFFFNYLQGGDGAQGFITKTSPSIKEDILGNEIVTYNMDIIDMRRVVTLSSNLNEGNLNNMAPASEIISWVQNQIRQRNYPYLGQGVSVEKMTVAPIPTFVGTGVVEGKELAQYTISVSLTYIHYID